MNSEMQKHMDAFCERFKGHLSLEQIAQGITAAIGNAKTLYADGLLLSDNDRNARAMSLFASCVEELGKVHVLQSMARIPKENQKLWAEAWGNFRDHEHKSTIGIADSFPDEARAEPELILAGAIQQRALAPLAERIRQFGLYTDFHGTEKRWMTPSEVTADDVNRFRTWAEVALKKLDAAFTLGLFSQQALAIQREVLGPLNVNRPRKADLTSQDLEELIEAAPDKMRAYFRRLVEAGILSADADVEIGGTPLRTLIK